MSRIRSFQSFIEDEFHPGLSCHSSTQDAIHAENICGPDVGLLKGKSRRPQQAAHNNEWIEIPKESCEIHAEVDLHIDIVCVNSIPHLIRIDGVVKLCKTLQA